MKIVPQSDVIVIGGHVNQRVGHHTLAVLGQDLFHEKLEAIFGRSLRRQRRESMERLRQLDDDATHRGRRQGHAVGHAHLAAEVGAFAREQRRGFGQRHAAEDQVLPVVRRMIVERPQTHATQVRPVLFARLQVQVLEYLQHVIPILFFFNSSKVNYSLLVTRAIFFYLILTKSPFFVKTVGF